MTRVHVSIAELALYAETDPKTVSRWLGGRVPHPRTRHRIAKRLREDEDFPWPGAGRPADEAADPSGVVRFYASRGLVPAMLWDRLLDQAVKEIGILVYVGMFLTEKPKLLPVLREKARAGARVRVMLGDRDADAVLRRSEDEGIGRHTISAKIDHAMSFFRPLVDEEGVELRTHSTVLYNSIYIFDNEMLVNPHIYGKTAPYAPAIHVRRAGEDDMFSTYASSFDAIWASATPVEPREKA